MEAGREERLYLRIQILKTQAAALEFNLSKDGEKGPEAGGIDIFQLTKV
jgi:hypothetical protein